jgi:hypothetical protein
MQCDAQNAEHHINTSTLTHSLHLNSGLMQTTGNLIMVSNS